MDKAFHRAECEVHEKVLYNNKKDALGAATGALRSRRLRVYECDAHPGKVHVTKENVKYRGDLKRHRR